MSTSNFTTFWASLSPDEKDDLATKAETSKAYLSQLASGHRNAGWRTVQKLVAADDRLTYDTFLPKSQVA